MRRNSTPGIGAFHPIVFFTLIYGISLFLALFVCRTVYYNIHGEEVVAKTTDQNFGNSTTAVAYR